MGIGGWGEESGGGRDGERGEGIGGWWKGGWSGERMGIGGWGGEKMGIGRWGGKGTG